jgi:hypothetical protein
MVTCWAETLGDCGTIQSREHYLSRSIIGSDDVVVSGFPFLKGETRTIPGERLVAKMLCKPHNEYLSPTDSAAGHFFQVLSAFKQRAIMRARGARKPGGIDMYDVDGALVERWMLKTLINVMFDRDLGADERWRPPDLWVRCAFGTSPFPAKCGLYLLEGEGSSQMTKHSAIGILPRTRSDRDDTLIGGQFRMADLQFALSMEPLHSSHQPLYRLRELKDKPSLELRQIAHFRWDGLLAD